MIYFAIQNNVVLNGMSEDREALELSLQANGFTNYEILSTQLDIVNNNEKYIFDFETKEWVLNPNYEAEQAERVNTARIEKIKAQLTAIDLKTIRALRAGETEYLQQYEAQAVSLREQLTELGVNDDSKLDA